MESTVDEVVRALGISRDAYTPTLGTHADPAAVERLGRALAGKLRVHGPIAVVVIWHSADDAVLAHVVARELGASVARATEDEGVVAIHPAPAAGTRVALLATSWTPARLRTLRTVSRPADVVAVGAITGAATETGPETGVETLLGDVR